jgi:uncharacterized protein (TIGR03437 family)
MEMVTTRMRSSRIGAMSMPSLLLIGFCITMSGQPSLLPVVGSGYELPAPIQVAPGQLVTLFVYDVQYDASGYIRQGGRAPAGIDLPTTLAGVYAEFDQLFNLKTLQLLVPMLDVHPFTASPAPNPTEAGTAMVGVTIQVPFEAALGAVVAVLGVLETGSASSPINVLPLSDQVHILTGCESFIPTLPGAILTGTGLPCPSIVTHADGSAVSVTSPAKAGEELVAYAVGLGQTNPASVTGQLVTKSAPTQTTFTLDYNFHPNALPSRPLPTGPQPIFAGTTPGYVGLYQVNFVVPPVPAGTPPCVDASALQPPYNVVQSNLTVSVGGQFSFDGARICVATN